MMPPSFRIAIAIILISLGGALLGRALARWAQQRLTRPQLLAQLLSGLAAIGIGVTFRMSRTTYPGAQWLELGCIGLFILGVLVDTRERSRMVH